MRAFRRIAFAASVVIIVSLCQAPGGVSARSWAPIDLVAFGSAHDVNEHGQVVGGGLRDTTSHGWLWHDGHMTDLGTLGGTGSEANAINDHGQVVGISLTASGDRHAFLWQAGVMTDLGTLGGTNSDAVDINNGGQVVGLSTTSTGDHHSFLWDSGTMIDLGTMDARAINDRGQILGSGVLWQDGTSTDLGTLGGAYVNARGLNDRGQIVGTSSTASGQYRGFLWQDGVMTALDLDNAYGISDRGQIVGVSRVQQTNRRHAFLWQSGVATDLGAPDGAWSEALAINERGEIAGDSGGEFYTHAELWPDAVAPDVTAPTVFPRLGSVLGAAVPATVRWGASDHGSALDRSRLQQQVGSGAWATIATTTGHSVTRNLALGTTYRFRVRARDNAGNWSAYHTGPAVRLTRYQESSSLATYDGAWRTATASAASGGSTRYATATDASVTMTITGLGFAWVAPKGPTRGNADVYVDGLRVATVGLYAPTTTSRVIVFAIRWSPAGTHAVKIVVAGTTGHPRVDLDAFILTR